MNGQMILAAFCLGAAALAAWLFVRYPSAGPSRISTVVLSFIGVFVAMSVAGSLFDLLVGIGGYGAAIGLMTVVLPTLTAAFWVCACGLRTLAATPGLHGRR
jgi:hypothetical protein